MAADRKHSSLQDSGRDTGAWSRLFRDLFQSDLIHPTDVNPDDIQFSRRMTVYRAMLILMLFSVLVVFIETAMTTEDNFPLLGISGVTAILLLATLVVVVRNHRVVVPPVITLAFNFTVVLLAIEDGAVHHIRWLFPLMIALAGLLPTAAALVFGVIALAALAGIQGFASSMNELAEAAALAATWLISLAVMRLLTQQSDELADLALSDPLTGAYNRRYLIPQAQRNLADFQRYSRLSTMLMIDIDHFKQINDKFGHPEGDKVLKAIVKLIDERIRGVDMLFRLGGEEFLVLLSEVGTTTGSKIADELRQAIGRLSVLPDQQVTVSIGVCDVTQVESAEDWLQKVDTAMYTAKDLGRDQVSAFDGGQSEISLEAGGVPIWR